jgi:hypothetical protein
MYWRTKINRKRALLHGKSTRRETAQMDVGLGYVDRHLAGIDEGNHAGPHTHQLRDIIE